MMMMIMMKKIFVGCCNTRHEEQEVHWLMEPRQKNVKEKIDVKKYYSNASSLIRNP